jgi:hypothetical protein
MRKLIAPVALAAAILMTGCTHVTKGKVVDRQFTPAHVDHWADHVCMSYDKSGFCTFSVPIEHSRNVPDRWELKLRDCGEDGKCKTGWLSVPEYVYNTVETDTFYDSKAPYTAPNGAYPPKCYSACS